MGCLTLQCVLSSRLAVSVLMLPEVNHACCRVSPAGQVYYLFSNNHINEIVSMRFDFDDDEVLVSCGVGASSAAVEWGAQALWSEEPAPCATVLHLCPRTVA